ncbi:hypothetical protein D3C80_1606490 [compost metagenome]
MTKVIFRAGFPTVNETVRGRIVWPQAQGGEDLLVGFKRGREHPHQRIKHQQSHQQQHDVTNSGADFFPAQCALNFTLSDFLRTGHG